MSIIKDLDLLLDKLKLQNVPEIWHKTWDNSMLTFPDRNIWFLEKDYLAEANDILMLPEEALKALIQAAAAIKADVSLCKLAWHCHCTIFHTPINENPWDFYFPSLEEYMGETAAMFSAVVLISGLRNAVDFNEARGIPDDITIDTFSDFRLWIDKYRRQYGKWGLGSNNSDNWLIFHLTNRLYKLGRLQYIPESFHRDIKVYRSVHTNKVIALSEAGIRFRRDGQIDGTSKVFDPDGAWISLLEVNGKTIKGNMISPYGHAIKDIVELPADEWIPVLSRGDTVLEIHIPQGSKLDHDICGESFYMAKEFFTRYFPERPFSAFACRTWFFDPQFQELMPVSSNIVKFQREFYLYPVPGNENRAFEWVFGGRPDDLSKAPRDTLLQRVILDHVMSGGHMYDAAGFILKDDLEWGREVYQKTGQITR